MQLRKKICHVRILNLLFNYVYSLDQMTSRIDFGSPWCHDQNAMKHRQSQAGFGNTNGNVFIVLNLSNI